MDLRARVRPLDTLPQVDLGYYSRAQREVRDTPLDINLQWRPDQTMAVHAGWLDAILDGHNRVASGLHIDAPICVLLSAKRKVGTATEGGLRKLIRNS